MSNPVLNTGNQVSNGIVAVTNSIALIPAFDITNNDNSRLNKAGFFISVMADRCVSMMQRLQVSVYCYAPVSLLPNAANYRFKMLKKLYR
jgi:hypothetical protein